MLFRWSAAYARVERRCKAKQCRRGKTTLTYGQFTPTVVRFLGRVQSGNTNILVTMAALCYFIIAQVVIADVESGLSVRDAVT
jgi:hypothetical protein